MHTKSPERVWKLLNTTEISNSHIQSKAQESVFLKVFRCIRWEARAENHEYFRV